MRQVLEAKNLSLLVYKCLATIKIPFKRIVSTSGLTFT